jgi:4-carboxymuconolactone decarboxylase
MASRPSSPRLAPLDHEQADELQQELLGALGGNRALNIFKTLVRHPKLFRRWSPFAGRLLQGSTLTHRDREIVILRTALRCGSAYEWGQHVAIAREAGLSDEEITAVASGADACDADTALLVRMVDELRDDSCITDATWAALAQRYGEEQLIELPMLSGHYALLAGVLNSVGVQPEGPLPALGQV